MEGIVRRARRFIRLAVWLAYFPVCMAWVTAYCLVSGLLEGLWLGLDAWVTGWRVLRG
jgi:hypothetical protein